jgi:hypothetical protein
VPSKNATRCTRVYSHLLDFTAYRWILHNFYILIFFYNATRTFTHLLRRLYSFSILFCILWGWDSSVVIATRYGLLDGPGIEYQCGRRFSQPSVPALGPTQPPIKWFPPISGGGGVKRPGRGFDYPAPSSAQVKERVEIYLYYPSEPSWPDLRWILCILVFKLSQCCGCSIL